MTWCQGFWKQYPTPVARPLRFQLGGLTVIQRTLATWWPTMVGALGASWRTCWCGINTRCSDYGNVDSSSFFANDGLFHSSSSCMTLEFQMAAARLEAFRSRCCCLMFVVNLMIEISSEKSPRGVLWFLRRRSSCFQNFIFLKFKM